MNTTTAAVVITNPLQPQIPVLSAEAMAKAMALAARASSMVVQLEPESLAEANALYREIDAHSKGIAQQRLVITRPLDALKDAIIKAERDATKPMDEARAALGKRIADADAEIRRIAAEVARKAREEAEAKAKAERDRLEKERQELIAKQEAERQAAADEAALFGTDLPPAAEPPPPVVVVPVVETPAQLAAPLPKCAVRQITRRVLFIEDPALIPRVIHGCVLLEPNEKAIKKLMEAGIEVPGCKLVNESSIGSAGTRGAA